MVKQKVVIGFFWHGVQIWPQFWASSAPSKGFCHFFPTHNSFQLVFHKNNICMCLVDRCLTNNKPPLLIQWKPAWCSSSVARSIATPRYGPCIYSGYLKPGRHSQIYPPRWNPKPFNGLHYNKNTTLCYTVASIKGTKLALFLVLYIIHTHTQWLKASHLEK